MMQCDDGLKEMERNPDVTLDCIVKDLLLFFKGFECLNEAERMIKMQFAIKEPDHKCWSEDYIKQAWKETEKEDIKSSRRRNWAHVIMLQIVKSFVCDACKQNTAQKNPHATTDEQDCETTLNPEDRIIQSKTELVTKGAVGGDEQMFGEEKKVSEISKLSGSSRDVSPSPTEENPNNSETRNAALMNKDNELHKSEIMDKAQSNKENSVDRSRQNNSEPKTVGAAGDVKQHSGGNDPTSHSLLEIQEENMHREETICICIPLKEMVGSEKAVQYTLPSVSGYKLTNGFPSDITKAVVKKGKSYVMSFDKATNNAKFVYEILNERTLANNCRQRSFGHDYVKGHLAAASNHRWCQEAYNDANLFSNIVPQNSILNNSTWKTLENKCRKMTKDNKISNVHVYTGPLYLKEVSNNGSKNFCTLEKNEMYRLEGKVIPTHLFKVIIAENVDGTVKEPECYLIPNDEPEHDDLKNYRVKIEYIERLSGLRFKQSHRNLGDTVRVTTVAFQGEDLNGKHCEAYIIVKLV